MSILHLAACASWSSTQKSYYCHTHTQIHTHTHAHTTHLYQCQRIGNRRKTERPKTGKLSLEHLWMKRWLIRVWLCGPQFAHFWEEIYLYASICTSEGTFAWTYTQLGTQISDKACPNYHNLLSLAGVHWGGNTKKDKCLKNWQLPEDFRKLR